MSGVGNRAPGRPATAQDIANLSAARAGQAASAGWTTEREAALRTLWDEGHVTAEIARRLGGGATKNAVVGRAHRLHLPARPSPVRRSANPAHVPRRDVPKRAPAVTLPAAAPAPVEAAASAPEPPAVVRRSPAPGGCCWPMWGNRERPTHLYCGAPASGRLRWCASHHRQGVSRRVPHAA